MRRDSPFRITAEQFAMLPQLTALQLEAYLTTKQISEMTTLSEDTVKRRYGDLYEDLSDKRRGIKMRRLLKRMAED